ncbi:MAG: RsbRD N-terminal domain-containing protein [Actinobacteria bacterium]|nr:RsbRD N-terminal domain-containing protein [Actinomycetota bacterium]MBU1942181.1 RsbRD N-terminal domain-containing protein [Actinomycetota bacterium]MBU2688054.1 RsbRD N-terminal domain-containing protein [Actinomycetota bacterium]
MIVASKLVKIIEKNADIIADRWADDVTTLPYTRSYWNVPRELLHERAASVANRLGYYVGRRLPKERLASFYRRLGMTRREEGYQVEEVVMALMLLKRHIWLFVLQEGFLTSNLELYQALELNNRVVLYFDRAIYYVAQAWGEADDKEEA